MKMIALQLGDLIRLDGLKKPDGDVPLALLHSKVDGLDVLAEKIEDNGQVTIGEMTRVFGDLANGMSSMEVDIFGDKLSWEEFSVISANNAKICKEIMAGKIDIDEGCYRCELTYLPLKIAQRLSGGSISSLYFADLRGLSMEAMKLLAKGGKRSVGLPAGVLDKQKAKVFATNTWENACITNARVINLEVLAELMRVKSLIFDFDEIDLDQAKLLGTHEGYLGLNYLTTINVRAAAELGKHNGSLTLGLSEIGAEEARLLAGNKGKLRLRNLEDLDKESAAGLATHSGSELRLGIRELDSVEVAAELIKHQGHLVLENLFRDTLPDEVAMVLATGHDLYAGGNADDKVEKFRKKNEV